MPDHRDALQVMFAEPNRFPNFGDALMRIHIQGFRCHSNTLIEVQSPITAFCGLNGTGKSTILQLSAAAYAKCTTRPWAYYIKDFLVVGTLDPKPFRDDAAVEYRYWQADRSLRPLRLSRNASTRRWQGYARRPPRHVLFVGVGHYLPKVEQRDFLTRNAHRLTVSKQSAVGAHIRDWTCKVLGQHYSSVQSNTVKCFNRTGTVISVERAGVSYSESHMGYGEGRTQYLISALEMLPEGSLILIEEPETSLHPSAQFEFGRYLVDVARRRRHQAFMTTHSEFLLEALPSQSRVYLSKTDSGIQTLLGLTALQAKSLMAQGHVKAVHLLVEDTCAKAVLTELLRRVDPEFLRSVGICEAGSAETIAATIRSLRLTGLPVAAVRDGDKGDAPRDNVFKLPGTQAPERELFASVAVKGYVAQTYGINLDDLTATLVGVDHHEWFARLSELANQDEGALIGEVARVYARNLPELEVSTLVTLLKEGSRR